MLGMHVRLGCPLGFDASTPELERISLLGPGTIAQVPRAIDAVVGADAVHTDTWVSMGQEAEKAERQRVFEGFTVDDAMMSAAAPGAVFMHCLPAYRGYEVAASVIDGPQSRAIRQGHNRMHAARGLIALLLGVR
jgi:ornithine carbamoyltransferase